MGYHRHGEVAICAWHAELWTSDSSKEWVWEHWDVLERLGVVVSKRGPRWVVEWSEGQARAFQLTHVFLHELGHHHDLMTTSSRLRSARGEAFAEQFALDLADELWDDFLRVFPL
jgi:hypothetical protein